MCSRDRHHFDTGWHLVPDAQATDQIRSSKLAAKAGVTMPLNSTNAKTIMRTPARSVMTGIRENEVERGAPDLMRCQRVETRGVPYVTR